MISINRNYNGRNDRVNENRYQLYRGQIPRLRTMRTYEEDMKDAVRQVVIINAPIDEHGDPVLGW